MMVLYKKGIASEIHPLSLIKGGMLMIKVTLNIDPVWVGTICQMILAAIAVARYVKENNSDRYKK